MCYSLCTETSHVNILNLRGAIQGMNGAEMLPGSHQGEWEERIFSTSQEDIQHLQDFIWSLMCTRKSCWQSALWADTSLLCWYLEPGKLHDHVSTEPASAGKPCWVWVCYFRLGTLLPSSPAFSSAQRDSPGSFSLHRAAARASSHQQVPFFFQALYMMTYF